MTATSCSIAAATLLVASLSLSAPARADDDPAPLPAPQPAWFLPPIPAGFPNTDSATPEQPQAVPESPPAEATAPAPPHAYSVNWDRVAACESGGNWAIHTANGFEGGVQFLNSTWLSVKAPDDPPHAYQASREQQMDAAERLVHRSGIGQWPVCGRRG